MGQESSQRLSFMRQETSQRQLSVLQKPNTHAVKEVTVIKTLIIYTRSVIVNCDNMSAINLVKNWSYY